MDIATLKPEEKPFLRPAELAEVFDVNQKTVLNAIHDGTIPCTKLGRAFLVPTAWVLRQAHLDDASQAD